ncbi:MAG: short-chain dehydrogenase [Candidatus Schekmanbacteria bacterium RBG_13_48_7]|uniref:Short-chain dehydrogenase n=1 Tax=Candidatus Schekmanbacteria bacterium RBG_13_48_7 TaxID=1817878 RepID=A0A1F7RNW0_9BACT|nr:MAG: short-chain dehydrogenase [Candidatus Schekmanbacteria bacterium RBG_13_48_7]
MELELKNKVALVTGASRGIGAAIARALAAHGVSVIINYKNSKQKAETLLAEIKKNGGTGMIAQADVRENDAVTQMVKNAIKEFGKIDILFNNANIDFPVKPFIAFSWMEMEAKIMGEMKALYNCSQAVLKGMIQQKSGKLVFISSGLSRHPGFGFCAHAAAKSAVDSIARVMAVELGPSGITVNVIGPGLVTTDATIHLPPEVHSRTAEITPLKRVGVPDDIAGVAVFLASRLSDFLTGEYIPVNGGIFML